MSSILKIILCAIFWGIFIYVVLIIPYPENLTQANIIQLLSFFIPLFLALTFTINIFLKFLIRSILITLGLVIFLILKALDVLNLVSFILTAVAIGLLLSYFKRGKGLTSASKLPKLTSLQPKVELQRRKR